MSKVKIEGLACCITAIEKPLSLLTQEQLTEKIAELGGIEITNFNVDGERTNDPERIAKEIIAYGRVTCDGPDGTNNVVWTDPKVIFADGWATFAMVGDRFFVIPSNPPMIVEKIEGTAMTDLAKRIRTELELAVGDNEEGGMRVELPHHYAEIDYYDEETGKFSITVFLRETKKIVYSCLNLRDDGVLNRIKDYVS